MRRTAMKREKSLKIKQISLFIILAVLCCWMVFSCEKRGANQAYRSGAAVVSIPADEVGKDDYDKRLVAVSGMATTTDMVTDPEFGVTLNTMHLRRQVQMYQWVEREVTRRGNDPRKRYATVTVGHGDDEEKITYEYSPEWSEQLVDSRTFHWGFFDDVKNPNTLPYPSRDFISARSYIELLEVPKRFVYRMPTTQTFTDVDITRFPPAYQQVANDAPQDGFFYVNGYSNPPQIGQIRVAFRFAPPTVVTIIAQKRGLLLLPYITRAGVDIELFAVGERAVDELLPSPPTMWPWRVTFYLMLLLFMIVTESIFVSSWPAWPTRREWIGVATLAAGVYVLIAGLAWRPYFPNSAWYILPVGAVLVFISLAVFYTQRRRGC